MKIIITGGTGLIGTALSHSLQKKGHQIIIVSRNPNQVLPGVKLISWDLDPLVHELENSDAVVNLAGASLAGKNPLNMRWTKKRKAGIINSRVMAGNLLSSALEQITHPPEVLIQASAIGYYGNSGLDPVDEYSTPGNDFLSDVCQSWESSTSRVEELGIRRVIARIGLVLSNRGGLLPLLSLPFRLYLGGRIGTGQQIMSWIHITDLVGCLEYFLDNHQTQGIYNLTAPGPVTNQEFANNLSRSLNKPAWLPIPSFALKMALGEASTLALDGREVPPRRLLDAGYPWKFDTLDQALSDLFI